MAKRQVVKEFLGKIVRAIGRKKGKKAAKKFLQSPEMKKLAKQSAELSKDIDKRLKKYLYHIPITVDKNSSFIINSNRFITCRDLSF